MTTKKIETEALKLEPEERAHLAARLLMSLEEPTASEVEKLWLDEAERRLNEYRSGEVKAIAAKEVFERILTELA